jgi:hypothetical protein
MQFRMASTTILAAALVATAACSGGENQTAATDSAAMGSATTPAGTITDSGMTTGTGTGVGAASANNLNDPSTVTQLDAIVSAAEGGLTSLSGSAAIAAIDPIREKLHNSGQPALESIADDLDALKDELEESKIDGAKVGAILNRVGPKVTTVSSSPGAPPALSKLGTLLTTAGGKLGGK